MAVDRELYAVSSHEYNFTVIGEVNDLLGVKIADVYWQLNTPLQQGPLDAGFGTQQVAGVSEGNPTLVEQFVDVRGDQ